MRTRAGGRHRRSGGFRVKALLVVGVVLAGLLAENSAWSAFRDGVTNPGNQFAAGTVVLTENSAGQA